MLLYPMFGGCGVGLEERSRYFIPETQLCIWDRAFPYQADHEFIKISTKERPLTIGTFIPEVFKGQVYQRKIAQDAWHYDEYEITHDGFGNKPVWLYAKDLKSISFNNFSNNTSPRVFEENFTLEYIRSLPDQTKILILFFI